MKLSAVEPKLRKLIKEFLDWSPRLKEKEWAEGRCYDTTEEFIFFLQDRDYKGDIRAIKADRLPEYSKYGDSHWIIWVDGLHIDFTAKQFHHSFALPRIWRGSRGYTMKKWTRDHSDHVGIASGIDAWQYYKIPRDK